MELLVRSSAHALTWNFATQRLEHVSVTQDSLGPAAPKSAPQGTSEQGARRCANAKLITLRGATLKMAHVIASLATKENTAQRVSTRIMRGNSADRIVFICDKQRLEQAEKPKTFIDFNCVS